MSYFRCKIPATFNSITKAQEVIANFPLPFPNLKYVIRKGIWNSRRREYNYNIFTVECLLFPFINEPNGIHIGYLNNGMPTEYPD